MTGPGSSSLVLGADGRAMPRGSRLASSDAPRTAHHAADPYSREMFAWSPPLLSADRAWLNERDPSIARLRDLLRNMPEARAALGTYTDHVIGSGLRLKLTPRYRALGISFDAAQEWARAVEAEWAADAADTLKFTDLHRRNSEGEMQRVAFQDWVATGEALCLTHWRERGGPSATCFQQVDPDRLSNPNRSVASERMRGGIEMDGDGVPVAYHFRKAHWSDSYIGSRTMEWQRVDASTDWGRPVVVHHFVATRPDQTRGEPALLAVVKLLRMGSRMTDTELSAAVISAMLLGAIESPFDHTMAQDLLSEEGRLSQYQQNRAAFHSERQINFGGLKVPTFYPGEKLHLFQNQRVQGALEAFTGLVDRRLSASIGGLTMAQITRDYSQANYSSMRAAMADAWKSLVADRHLFGAGYNTPRFLAWLEEKVMTGALPLPKGVDDFYAAYRHLVVCGWRGPGRGVVDPTKEAQGSQMRMDSMLSTLDYEAAEMGFDYQELLEQRARERDLMEELGLQEPQWAMLLPERRSQPEGGPDA